MKTRSSVFVFLSTILICSEGNASISTIPSWNGTDFVYEVGETNTAYYGQTFLAPAGLAQDFTFFLDWSSGAGPMDFRVLLTTTQTFVGNIRPSTVLFESSPLTLPVDNDNTFTSYTVNFGGIDLVDGDRYALIIDAFSEFDGVSGTAKQGSITNGGSADPNGIFIYYNESGGDRSNHFNSQWANVSSWDAAYSLTFSDPAVVPEPWSIAVWACLAGVAGVVSYRRRLLP
jgi:hypothetical protein